MASPETRGKALNGLPDSRPRLRQVNAGSHSGHRWIAEGLLVADADRIAGPQFVAMNAAIARTLVERDRLGLQGARLESNGEVADAAGLVLQGAQHRRAEAAPAEG